MEKDAEIFLNISKSFVKILFLSLTEFTLFIEGLRLSDNILIRYRDKCTESLEIFIEIFLMNFHKEIIHKLLESSKSFTSKRKFLQFYDNKHLCNSKTYGTIET